MTTYYLQNNSVDLFSSLSYWNDDQAGGGSDPSAWANTDSYDMNGLNGFISTDPSCAINLVDSINTSLLTLSGHVYFSLYCSVPISLSGTVIFHAETDIAAAVTLNGNAIYFRQPDAAFVMESAGGSLPASRVLNYLEGNLAGGTLARSDVKTTADGTLNMSLYVLITDVVAPQYVAVGHDNYVGGEAGTFEGGTPSPLILEP